MQCLLVPIRRIALVEAACPKPRADESWVTQPLDCGYAICKIAEKHKKRPPTRTEILVGGVNIMPLLKQRRHRHEHRLLLRGLG